MTNVFYLFSFKEYETKMRPWLWSFAVFTALRILASLFFAIVNDLIFAYNLFMAFLWLILACTCVYCWMVVYSFFLELRDLSKLEDLAHLRVIFFICFFSFRFVIKVEYLLFFLVIKIIVK